jgi:intraflagellar transport protein 88
MACQYTHAGNYTEALNIYNLLTKNKLFQVSGRLKTNIGNIYFKQKQYLKAIKMYRMALDQIPLTNQSLKFDVFFFLLSFFSILSVTQCYHS